MTLVDEQRIEVLVAAEAFGDGNQPHAGVSKRSEPRLCGSPMIRWCAYCQRFQGEAAPFDDYSMTHTICSRCEATGAFLRKQPRTLERIQDFFSRVARGGTDPGVTALDVVHEGAALGLDPVDLLLGIVQPVLRQIGDRWARAEATIAEEHRISALCVGVSLMLLESDESLAALRQTRPPRVLLVAAEGNQHTIGLQIMEVVLLRNHISTVTAYPGLPDDEVVRLARSLRPRVVAISAALPNQVASAVAVARRLSEWPPAERPRIVVGGLGVRCEPSPVLGDGSLSVCTELRSLIELAACA